MHSNSSKFTIIKGGKDLQEAKNRFRFLSGSITNTRLMGVAALFLSWTAVGSPGIRYLHQLFYLDFEARSIDTYMESRHPEDAAFSEERDRLTAALGGSLSDISEQEARFLVQAHAPTGKIPAADTEGAQEGPAFLLTPAVSLQETEYRKLMAKLCAPLLTPLYTVNYFLMRAAALDAAGLAWLSSSGGFPEDATVLPADIPERHLPTPFNIRQPVVFCLNQTEKHEDPDTWLCQSLTEREDAYYISNTALTLSKDRFSVKEASLLSEFRITQVEAAMMLRRTEYVTAYQIPEESQEFNEIFHRFTRLCTETAYRNGRLFINYFDNNDHAGSASYRINDDVKTVLYLSDQGELLVMNYSLDYALEAEYDCLTAFLRYPAMFPGIRFEFPEPVLYEYINSDFDSFMEFLDYFTEEDPQ